MTDDSYYYADNNNYTDNYIQSEGLSHQISSIVGIVYIVTCSLTLLGYIRLLFVSLN